jgi:hypothetical protein
MLGMRTGIENEHGDEVGEGEGRHGLVVTL